MAHDPSGAQLSASPEGLSLTGQHPGVWKAPPFPARSSPGARRWSLVSAGLDPPAFSEAQALHSWSHVMFMTCPGVGVIMPIFTDGETEAQGDWVTGQAQAGLVSAGPICAAPQCLLLLTSPASPRQGRGGAVTEPGASSRARRVQGPALARLRSLARVMAEDGPVPGPVRSPWVVQPGNGKAISWSWAQPLRAACLLPLASRGGAWLTCPLPGRAGVLGPSPGELTRCSSPSPNQRKVLT